MDRWGNQHQQAAWGKLATAWSAQPSTETYERFSCSQETAFPFCRAPRPFAEEIGRTGAVWVASPKSPVQGSRAVRNDDVSCLICRTQNYGMQTKLP